MNFIRDLHEECMVSEISKRKSYVSYSKVMIRLGISNKA